MEAFFNDFGEFLSSFFYIFVSGIYYIYITVAAWLEEIFLNISLPLMPSTSKILNYKAVSGTVFAVFLIYIVMINIKTFKLFLKDKAYAVEQRNRIREDKLLKYCFIGGALGGYLGMRAANHKTRKNKFRIGISIMLVMQGLLFGIICGFFGFWLCLS